MKKRLTAERRNEIAQLLIRDGNIKAGELAKQFDVSTETIRKDLIYLEEQGIAQKSYGGAIASTELLERPVTLKQMEHMEIKTEIANKALELIPENGVIILDTGSTVYALAKLLTLRSDLTIFTNSMVVVNILSDSDNKVFSLGGRVRGSSKGTVGAWAIQALRTIHADIAFLGSDGFKNLSGPSSASYEEAELKKAMISCCEHAVVLCENTKFTTNSLFQFCEWEEIYALITNRITQNSDDPNDDDHSDIVHDFDFAVSKINKKTNVILSN
ncbi:MAG: DeoR/GlpR family DNA-binding transcription regulator [Lachnospiraceae bacterium]